MHRIGFLAVFTFCLLLSGCSRSHFVLELTPDGECFQRELTAWTETYDDPPKLSELSSAEVQRIAELYQAQPPRRDGEKAVFSSRFCGDTPADVGGAGRLEYFTSPLGAVSFYSERFRGQDDADAELAKRRAAIDRTIELLMGWAQTEIDDASVNQRVQRFLDRQLRGDLKNLAIYLWTYDALPPLESQNQDELAVRLLQYLGERDYFAMSELPQLYSVITQEDPNQSAALVQRLVARKIGVGADEPVPESLDFLGDWQRLETSLGAYLAETDAYRAKLAQWEAQRASGSDANAKRPQPIEVLGDEIGAALFEFQKSSSDAIDVRLHLKFEPFATNGHWDNEAQMVQWSESLAQHRALPMLVYAAWSVPLEETQLKHFGQVLLKGADLATYVMWYRGLSAQAAGEWDTFLAELTPQTDYVPKLAAFRFRTDAPPAGEANEDRQPGDRAKPARELILGKLAEMQNPQ